MVVAVVPVIAGVIVVSVAKTPVVLAGQYAAALAPAAEAYLVPRLTEFPPC